MDSGCFLLVLLFTCMLAESENIFFLHELIHFKIARWLKTAHSGCCGWFRDEQQESGDIAGVYVMWQKVEQRARFTVLDAFFRKLV